MLIINNLGIRLRLFLNWLREHEIYKLLWLYDSLFVVRYYSIVIARIKEIYAVTCEYVCKI